MPDKRLDEIQERMKYIPSGKYQALDGAKVTLDGQEFLDDCGTLDIAEFIAHAPTDLAYLLTRLKAAEDTLNKICNTPITLDVAEDIDKACHRLQWQAGIARDHLTTWHEARDD